MTPRNRECRYYFQFIDEETGSERLTDLLHMTQLISGIDRTQSKILILNPEFFSLSSHFVMVLEENWHSTRSFSSSQHGPESYWHLFPLYSPLQGSQILSQRFLSDNRIFALYGKPFYLNYTTGLSANIRSNKRAVHIFHLALVMQVTVIQLLFSL